MQPKTLGLLYFQKKFGTEKPCQKQLCRLRWPEGFKCPRGGQAAAYPYLVLDARYEKSREDGVIRSQAVQIAIGINDEGRRHILAAELANRESQTSWRDVLLELKSRGVRGVEFVVSDDHPALTPLPNFHLGKKGQNFQGHETFGILTIRLAGLKFYHVLGLTLAVDKLRFTPCLPADWPGFTMHYRYRETVYHIIVQRPPAEKGSTRVTVDGVDQPDNTIPLIDGHLEHYVELSLSAVRSLM